VLATRNGGKLREIVATLGQLPVEVVGLAQIDPQGHLVEPEETGLTFAENAILKARYYAQAASCWTLADDSGLEVDALQGRPGVYSARYAAALCSADVARDVLDSANNRLLLKELEGVSDERRTARFVCHLALCDGELILLQSRGVIEGRIAHQASGRNGFGYDPLFWLAGYGRTMASLPAEAKNAISHRGQAVRLFAEGLRKLLGERR
jgi:XTP/dITP diphosphohydrolase